MKVTRLVSSSLAAAVSFIAFGSLAQSQTVSLTNPANITGLAPLTATATPTPSLTGIVRDVAAARRLGKALFWDKNVGSDGMACASCHFAAGADTRLTNQISPGLDDQRYEAGDSAFGGLTGTAGMTGLAAQVMAAWPQDFSPGSTGGKLAGGGTAGAGVTLTANDFPTHQLQNVNDPNSAITYTTNDAVSSQGVTPATFVGLTDEFGELCTPNLDSPFIERKRNGSMLLRAVEPRNSPTVINSGFHYRNFWDGRANNVFNGFDPFGHRSPAASLLQWTAKTNTISVRRLSLTNAGLASQAVGPPLSHIEMSCGGKTFAVLGRKLLDLPALRDQQIATTDSVLGTIATNRPNYRALIQQAFDPSWWNAPATVKYKRGANGLVADPQGFTQMELNFPMYFGIAVMLYESTLVSGQTPYDRSLGGQGPRTLTATEQAGQAIFTGKGKCVACHAGPILSKGTVAEVEYMPMADAGNAFYDGSFYNIGVNSTVSDLGLGAVDPWGNPLSFTRQLTTNRIVDNFAANFCTSEAIPFPATRCDPAKQLSQLTATAASQRVAIDGAFQTPTLRNIGLTPPYFHNGTAGTLAQVVELYNRGGNRRGTMANNTSGTGALGRPLGDGDPVAAYRQGSNLDADIVGLGLTATEQQQLVAFLLALTDERVRCDRAPFDHPELPIPAAGGATIEFLLPAVGAAGLTSCRPNSGNLMTESAHLKSQFGVGR